MKRSSMSIIFILLFAFLSNNINAQGELGVVGKIFSKVEADKLFGKVLESKTIMSETLLDALNKVDYYIMFKLEDGQVAIADKFRNQITDTKVDLKADDVMHIYSKTKVAEVISNGGESLTTIEIRSEVMTITNGAYTLEMSATCPPICP